MPRKPVIFLHIPKTAGGTLRYVVTRQYKAHQTVEAYHRRQKNARYIDDLKMMNAAEKSEIQLVQGHTKFGAHQFFEKEMPYILSLIHI